MRVWKRSLGKVVLSFLIDSMIKLKNSAHLVYKERIKVAHTGTRQSENYNGNHQTPPEASSQMNGSPHIVLVEDLLSLLPRAPVFSQFVADGPGIAKHFLRCREDFRSCNKPNLVKVGFHYTLTKGKYKGTVENIRCCGLRPSNRAYYGSGIYLGGNPHAFSTYGDTCILVLYIPGTMINLGKLGKLGKSDMHQDADSFCGNKLSKRTRFWRQFRPAKTTYFDEIIVQSKIQVLPVFAYPRSAVNNADQLHLFHKQVQELVDRTINYAEDYNTSVEASNTYKGIHVFPRKTSIPRIFPSYEDLQYEHKLYKKREGRYQQENRLVFFHDGTFLARSVHIPLI
mmetsp:Transcript_6601/g.16085  ORF Transcript_6601/g.16085 Transcript_6601/m.16085 type:complete len:341 (-) Transcript_6601:1353-2375(-)